MDPTVLGFLVTLANINNYSNSGGTLKDLSIKVAEVQTLYSDLQADPGLDLASFKNSGYYRHGNTGKYLSKNLRDYMFKGVGNPHDEGVILSLTFVDKNEQGILKNGNDNLSIFLHKEMRDGVKEQVQGYLDNRYGYSD